MCRKVLKYSNSSHGLKLRGFSTNDKTYSMWCLNTPDKEFYYKLTDVIRWVYIDELEKTLAD